MKKIFTILFLIIYGILTAGVNVMVHTCGNDSEAAVVASKIIDPCGCVETLPDNGQASIDQSDMCCSVELSSIKIDDNQNAVQIFNCSPLPNTAAVVSDTDVLSPRSNAAHTIIEPSPPPKSHINITNCVFLI